jgi:heme exporter protein C
MVEACDSIRARVAGFAVAGLVGTSLLLIFFVAPTEATMGAVQRILYIHVAVAWCGLAGIVGMTVFGAVYLFHRQLKWDFWAQASGEVGWLATTLTLITGSAWAHEAWGTWWTWEPRLTSSLVLWIIYAGIFLVRASIEDSRRRARIGAALAIVGVSDVPLIIMATRWFRGVHPVSPEMDLTMRWVLVASVISISAVFAYLAFCRQHHLVLADRTADMEISYGPETLYRPVR